VASCCKWLEKRSGYGGKWKCKFCTHSEFIANCIVAIEEEKENEDFPAGHVGGTMSAIIVNVAIIKRVSVKNRNKLSLVNESCFIE